MPIILFEIKIIITGYLSFWLFLYHIDTIDSDYLYYYKDIVNSDYFIIT